LYVIDISEPTNPTQSAFLPIDGEIWDIVVSGNYAYLANRGGYGLCIVDISNPIQPVDKVHYTTGSPFSVTIQNNLLFIAMDYRMEIVDISDPLNPKQIWDDRIVGTIRKIEVRDTLAYLASMHCGLQVYSISDPAQPRFITSIPTWNWTFGVAVSGNFAYMAENDAGIRVIDISDPDTLIQIGNYNTGSKARNIFADKDMIYVADYVDGVYIFQNPLYTKIEDHKKPLLPDQLVLYPNYPNPFNPSTTIEYELPKSGPVRLTIYNLLGQKVRTLLNARQNAGRHHVVWDGCDETCRPVSSGVYYYRLEAGVTTQTKKMMLLR